MKKMIWRLSKLPTADEISLLVRDGVLTKEEAREILFKEETEEDRNKASLESEIKFLRELVEKLSNRQTIIKEIETIKVPYYKRDWYEPYKMWCSTSGGATYLATNTGNSSNMTLTAYNASLPAESSFKDIKTF